MAFEIEKRYNKNEILELHQNTSYFGDGYYTVKEASRGYFGKDSIEMRDSECIMLAGIPNAQSVYAPTKNLKLAKQRQEQVIKSRIISSTFWSKNCVTILFNINYNLYFGGRIELYPLK